MDEQRRRDIGAEPDIERVAERELAGEAHHDVPGLAEIGEIEDENEDGQQVVVDEQRGADQDDQQRGEQQQGAPRNAPGQPSRS